MCYRNNETFIGKKITMPSGETHIKINWIVLIIINIIIVFFHTIIEIKEFALFNILYILMSYLISPDLDIDSSVYKRWGIFRWIWYPYREIMKHRGLSHSVVFGPISIIFNLVLYILPVILFINMIDQIPIIRFEGQLAEVTLISIICIFIIVEIHILADKIF